MKRYSCMLLHGIMREQLFPPESVLCEPDHIRWTSFLDLLSSAPGSFFVPTLDIDLAWHTHQMMGHEYGVNCLRYVGRYIDQ